MDVKMNFGVSHLTNEKNSGPAFQSGHLCTRMDLSVMYTHGKVIFWKTFNFLFSFNWLMESSLKPFISMGNQWELSFLPITSVLIKIFTIRKKVLGAENAPYKAILTLKYGQ